LLSDKQTTTSSKVEPVIISQGLLRVRHNTPKLERGTEGRRGAQGSRARRVHMEPPLWLLAGCPGATLLGYFRSSGFSSHGSLSQFWIPEAMAGRVRHPPIWSGDRN
jgi:hypothetical protein